MKQAIVTLWKAISAIYFSFFGMLLFSIPVAAYIDPSAATYMIQIIAGIAIAGGAAFGFYFRKLKRKLSQLEKKGDPLEDEDQDDPDDDDDTGMKDYE